MRKTKRAILWVLLHGAFFAMGLEVYRGDLLREIVSDWAGGYCLFLLWVTDATNVEEEKNKPRE